MRIALFLNGWVGWQILLWLRQQEADVVALVLHPTDRRKFGKEILEALSWNEKDVIDGSKLSDQEALYKLQGLKPDLGISAFFGYILRRECLDLFPKGCVNVHPAYLPYGQGAFPNVWSIVDRTPAGATIHYIDEGVDTGDIIAQKEVPIDPTDTGASLYQKLEAVCISLFKETWPMLVSGAVPRVPQKKKEGTSHRVSDASMIDEIHLDNPYTARDIIDLIRARTFNHFPGAYFVDQNGERVYLRLQLLRGEEIGGKSDPPLHHKD